MTELIDHHQPELQAEEDRRVVRFLFPRDNRMDSEVVWIQANYLDVAGRAKLLRSVVKGRLREHLRAIQSRSVGTLTVICKH